MAPGHREQTQTFCGDYVGFARRGGYATAEILLLSAFGVALSCCNVASIKTNGMYRVGLRLAA